MTPDLPSTAHDDTKMTMTTETSERNDTSTTLRDNAEVAEALSRRYEAGFVTDIETDSLPPGLSEDIVRQLSALKQEPEWMTEWRLKAYRHWLTMPTPDWAKLNSSRSTIQAISYYAAPKQGPKSLDEVDPKLLETYEKLGVPLHERAKLAGVAVDAVFDSVSVGTTFRKELAEAGVIFCSMTEAIREHRRAGAAVSGQRGADRRQLFRRPELGRVLRRLVRVHPQGRALPDGAEHVLPHQRDQHGTVRAHLDRRGRGRLRVLPRRLHRADARREPAARRRGRTGRARTTRRSSIRPCRTGIRATRTASAASTTS